jgi:hypothetical protein
MSDWPVIDPAVRAAMTDGCARVLVELRVPVRDPSTIATVQHEVLRRLNGTSARLTRAYATTPLLALEIDAAALGRLEGMTDLVTRVRADRISSPYEGSGPRR